MCVANMCDKSAMVSEKPLGKLTPEQGTFTLIFSRFFAHLGWRYFQVHMSMRPMYQIMWYKGRSRLVKKKSCAPSPWPVFARHL